MFGLSDSSGSFYVQKGQSEAMMMAIEALGKLSMKIVKVDVANGFILAKVTGGFRSFGEDVIIQLKSFNEGTMMSIESECNNRRQKIDWGKNKDNVNQIIKKLSALQNNDYPNADSSLMAIMNQVNAKGSGSGCMVLFVGLFIIIGILL